MASQAEVDLIISTADTLPELERDLASIIRIAEDGAPELDVQASMNVQASIAELSTELGRVIQAAEAGASDIDLQAALDAQESLTRIRADLAELNQSVNNSAVDTIDLHAALNFSESLVEVQESIRDLVATAEVTAPEIEIEAEVDRDGRARSSILNLGRAFGSLAGPLGAASKGIVGAGLAAGAAVPLLAGVATAVASIAPAAAVATTGMLAVQLVSGTLKLAMQGVGDAISTAFDPEAKPEDLAKAMEKLAPAAKEFVTELQGMREEFKELQQGVQENFFAGLDDTLVGLKEDVLPQVGAALRDVATELSSMASGAGEAAAQLGRDGTLGTALEGATNGIANLVDVPGQAVTALGQLAAAAAPAFERVTAAAAGSATSISEKLSKAFESGALDEAINSAVDAISQLGRIAGNVFGGLGNILGTVSSEGEGLFSTLEKVTQAFEDVTASTGFQQALTALVQTAGVVADTVLPLLSTALQALGPVFQAIGPPIQILVRALGDGLTRVVVALEPVLTAIGLAFGQLVIAITPLIDLAADLLVAVLPGLIPLFDGLGQTLNAVVPFIEALATALSGALVPLFTTLATEVMPALIPPLVELSTALLPVLTEVIIKLSPTLATLATTFGQLVVALVPLIVSLADLTTQLLDDLGPAIGPLIDLLLKLVTEGLNFLASTVTGVIIPIINILVDLINGDFSGAWKSIQELIRNVALKIQEIINAMGNKLVEILADLGNRGRAKVTEFTVGVLSKINELGIKAGEIMRRLPGTILSALGDLGNLLVSAGGDLIQGLINGITGKLGRLREIAGQVASTVSGSVKDLLGISSPSKVMMDVGNDTMDGFLLGLQDRVPDLRGDLQSIAGMVPSFALPNGQTLQLPQLSQGAPTVQVYLGNELLNNHVDARIVRSNVNRDRVATQGVRR